MPTHVVFGVVPNQSESELLPDKPEETNLCNLMRARIQLDARIHHEARRVLEPGLSVYWDHHGYEQEGVVLTVVGFPGHTSVRVRNVHTECIRQLSLRELKFE